MPIAVLGIVVYVIYYYLGRRISNYIPGAAALYGDSNLGQQYAWNFATGTGGIALTVINALTPEWYPYFDLAVQEWDNGTPDSLTLTTQISVPDANCSFAPGFLKMCNGDYGTTDWTGLNQVVLNNDRIESSVGMMNDHFFRSNDADKRQYTMCHEMGHGFGLPHTDVNMWNRDTGNCEFDRVV